MATAPYEIIVAPFEIYVAPNGEAFPDVDEAPAGNWVKLGTSGVESMESAGVTVQHNGTVDFHRPYGTTAPVKATRSSEDLIISFTLWDLLAAEYARVLNHNPVSATAAGSGTPGYDTVNIYQGLNVTNKAWLVKSIDASPEGDTWNMQYEIPKAVVMGSPSVAYSKSVPAGLAFQIQALFDTAEAAGEALGRLIIQDATALA